jgi:hypothetical protein
MRAGIRGLIGGATTLALTAAMVAITTSVAGAAPTKPVISSIVASGGTFTSPPASGTELNPKVTVSGVLSGDVVSIYVDGGSVAATCTATATSVTFNAPTGSNCSVPATFNVGAGDGNYALSSDRVSGAAGQSPRSDAFNYIRDTAQPTAPASATASQLPGAQIRVQFPTSLDSAPFPSGVTSYNVYRSQPNPPGGAANGEAVTTNYTKVGSTTSCGGSGSTACTYVDGSAVPPSNANSYFYKVTAVDKAGNEGPKSPASNYVAADGSAPTAPSGLTVDPGAGGQDAGFGHNNNPTTTVTLGGEASTIKLLINNVVVDTQVVSGGTTSFTWNAPGPAHVVSFAPDGTKSVTVTATDGVGNTSTSGAVSYILDTVAPAAPTMTVSNRSGSSISANDKTPQVVVSGVANLEHLTLNVNKVNVADANSTNFASISDGTPKTFNPDGCDDITSTTPCDFTLSGPSPQTSIFTASARDRAGNPSPSNAVVNYTYDTTGPDVSTILSMGNPADTTSPASGTDRTPDMVVRVSSDTTRVDVFRGAELNPLGSVTASDHTVTCPSVVASTFCVELNKAATDHDFVVSAGANVLKARAFDASLNYKDSATFEWDGTDTQAPPPPTGKPTTNLSSGGQLSIDWQDVVDAADGGGASSNPVTYDIQKASSARASNGTCPDPATLTFTTLHTGLTSSNDTDTLNPVGNCYFYRVRSVDGAQNASAYGTPSDAAGEVKPHVGGYLLDSYGGIHPVNGSVATTKGPYFGFDIARDLVMLPDKSGGFVLDGYGGIHGFAVGNAAKPVTPGGGPYFQNFDIARSIVLVNATSGYVLDGFGGVHPFGGAPVVTGAPYFGFDIARRLVMTGAASGYVLDGYGAAHPFGTAPALSGTPYYSGFDIARDLVLTGTGKGYELDGFGGVHPFGGAPPAASSSYTSGSDIARTIVVTEPDLDGGLMLDGYGKVSTFGDAAPIPRPATFGSTYARRLVVILT